MSEAPRLRTGFAVAAAAVVAVLWYGALAPRDPDFDTTTVLEAWRGPGIVPLGITTAVMAVLFASRPVADRLADVAGSLFRRADPSLAAALAAITLMWTHTDTSLSGDALDIVQRTARGHIAYDHPLSGLLFALVHRWTGADAYDAVRITSQSTGTLYAVAVVAYAARTFPARRQRFAATVLLLTAGCVALFAGSVEVYAVPALAMLLFLVAALRRFREDEAARGPFLLPAAAFGTFAACHGIALFTGVAVLLLLLRERRLGASAARLAAWCGTAVLPLAASLVALHLSGLGLREPAGGDAGRFLAFAKSAASPQHRYAFADAEHLVGVLATLFVAGPAAWALVSSEGRAASRARPESRGETRLLVAALLPLLVLPFVWNLAYTLRRDWDLFSLAGIPLALLAAHTVVAAGLSRADVLRVAALACFAFVPFQRMQAGDAAQRRDHAVAVRWTLAATGATSDVIARWDARIRDLDPAEITARLDRAITAAGAGRTDEAETLAHGVLADEPENVHALTVVGEILAARVASAPDAAAGSADAAEAERLLRHAISHPRENLRPRPRLALAKLLLSQGRKDEARAQLDRLVREDCQHPVAAEALTLLAPLVREAGDAAAAAAITDLAAKRRVR